MIQSLKTFFRKTGCVVMMMYWRMIRDNQDMFEYYYQKSKEE